MKKYRIHNWAEYNRSLVKRGSINIWFSDEAIKKWHTTSHTERKGRPQVYSDDAILCALVIREAYNLTLRQVQGFLASMVEIMGLDIRVPSYTQICRRARSLEKALKRLKLP